MTAGLLQDDGVEPFVQRQPGSARRSLGSFAGFISNTFDAPRKAKSHAHTRIRGEVGENPDEFVEPRHVNDGLRRRPVLRPRPDFLPVAVNKRLTFSVRHSLDIAPRNFAGGRRGANLGRTGVRFSGQNAPMLPTPEVAGLGFGRVRTNSKFAAGRGWRTKAAATSAAVLAVPGTMRKCRRYPPGLPSLSWRKRPVSRYARCDLSEQGIASAPRRAGRAFQPGR